MIFLFDDPGKAGEGPSRLIREGRRSPWRRRPVADPRYTRFRGRRGLIEGRLAEV